MTNRRWFLRALAALPLLPIAAKVTAASELVGMSPSAVNNVLRSVNYWETSQTELIRLSPRVPFYGEAGTFWEEQARG